MSDIMFVICMLALHGFFSCFFAQSLHDDEQKVIMKAGSFRPVDPSFYEVFEHLDSLYIV